MEKIVSVTEMQAIEREANARGLSYAQMMENAGSGLAKEIDIAYSHITDQSVLALVGSGNNGGDALVALAGLAELGWRICAYLVRPRAKDDPLVESVRKQNGLIYAADEDGDFRQLLNLLESHKVLIDGVLGTGIRLPLHNDVAACLEFVHRHAKDHPKLLHVVSVDCPSGVDCDLGLVAEEAIPAELTVTMAAVKRGLLSFPAADLIGALRVVSIGDLSELNTWQKNKCWLLDENWVQQQLPPRPRSAHKGTFGTALIVAGSVSYTGAALLAGEAAYRVGVGLVQMAVPAPLHQVLAGQIPEVIWLLLPHENGFIAAEAVDVVLDSLHKANAVLVGPGFGLQATTQEFIRLLFSTRGNASMMPPLVIDADGLKLLTGVRDWYKMLPDLTILTPHPGEMATLSSLQIDQIQADRIGTAQKYAALWGHVIVLKGAFTVIASPEGRTAIVPVSTPALARAGTGDVLAGIIVSLLAQGIMPYEAAAVGSWIHANAGLKAEAQLGVGSVLAGDLLPILSQVLIDLNQK
jgi:NAD(P)H-hydrate epimerase